MSYAVKIRRDMDSGRLAIGDQREAVMIRLRHPSDRVMRLLLFGSLIAPFVALSHSPLPRQLALWSWAPMLVTVDRLGQGTPHAALWRRLAYLVGGFWLFIL